MARTPTTERARRTCDRILDAALELFNTDGTAAVTTNRIAEAAGLSPGNLYYWFDDKNQIIRELYGRLVREYDGLWQPQDRPSPDEFLALLTDGAALAERYEFLARELFGLLHGDEALARDYRIVRRRRAEAFAAIAREWRSRGLIHAIDDGNIDDVLQAMWIIGDSWFPLSEFDDNDATPGTGTRLMRAVLLPYLVGESD